MPLKNAANYIHNIKQYVKESFLGYEAADEDIKAFLRMFHEARKNPEKRAELTFKYIDLPYRLDPKFMFYEIKNGTVIVTSLAGMHSWLADNIIVEVPTGKDAGKYSLFEEQKENLYNWERWVLGSLKSITATDPELGKKTIDQAIVKLEYNAQKAGALSYASKCIRDTVDLKQDTVDEMIVMAEKIIESMKESLARIDEKSKGYKLKRKKGVLDTDLNAKDIVNSHIRKDILRVPMGGAINRVEEELNKELSILDTGYRRLGELFSERYLEHKRSGKGRPFVVTIKGDGGVGKTTLIRVMKKRLEGLGLKVATPSKVAYWDVMGYLTWHSYEEIINNNKKVAIILCEFTDVLPVSDDYHEFLDLFVQIKSELDIQRNRLKAKGISEDMLDRIVPAPEVDNYKDRPPDIIVINKKGDAGEWFSEAEMDKLFTSGLTTAFFADKVKSLPIQQTISTSI
jgi:hypothetical protein